MINALVVSPTPTWPLNFGNRKRIYTVCEELKKRGVRIYFLHYASEMDWRKDIPLDSYKKMNEQWEYVSHIMPSRYLHCDPEDGVDHKVDEWWDWEIEHGIKSLSEKVKFDLIYVNYTWLSRSLDFVGNIFKVLDTHDVFSNRRKLLENNGIKPEFFHTTYEEEKYAIERADLVYAIKPEEQMYFEKMSQNVLVRTLGHFDQARDGSVVNLDKPVLTVGIIGANNNINKVNIQKFIEIAEPIFTKYLPALEVKLAGSMTLDLNVSNSNYFSNVGYVDDINEFYDSCDVIAVPMEFSTGLKIKVAEALSQSKPLVCHEHAMEGFPSSNSEHLCKSFEEMAKLLCEVAYDRHLLTQMKQNSIDVFKSLQSACSNEIDSLIVKSLSKYKKIVILPDDLELLTESENWLLKNFFYNCSDDHYLISTNESATKLNKDIHFGTEDVIEQFIKCFDSVESEKIIDLRSLNFSQIIAQIKVMDDDPIQSDNEDKATVLSSDLSVISDLKSELYHTKERLKDIENSKTWVYGQKIARVISMLIPSQQNR